MFLGLGSMFIPLYPQEALRPAYVPEGAACLRLER